MADQSNIFDESSKRFSGKNKQSSKSDKLLNTKKMAPPPPYAQDKLPTEQEEALNLDNITVTGVLRMIEKYRKMHDKVERQLDEVYQKTGFTPTQIKDYLSNPNNFNKNEWERIQKKHLEFENSFNIKKDENSLIRSMSTHEKKESKPSHRSKNGRGRKNWIEVR
jgi:hypothetical protein